MSGFSTFKYQSSVDDLIGSLAKEFAKSQPVAVKVASVTKPTVKLADLVDFSIKCAEALEEASQSPEAADAVLTFIDQELT